LTTVEAMADWILALLAVVRARSASIVGHSMGSLVALETAARNTSRTDSRAVKRAAIIDRIALVATAYPMQVSGVLLEAAQNDEPRAIEMISLWASDTAHGGFSHKPSSPAPGFGIVWGGRRLMQRQAKGVLRNDFAACNAYRNGEAAARDVRCPALFLLGANDAMTAARSGKALAAMLRDARVVELPRVGHTVMGEAPDHVLDALKGFLA
jgi:pimeloyl-ACP methyl ester carboxylesterase